MISRRLALSVLLVTAATAALGASPVQRYRLVGEPDVASELILHPDGRFHYFLSAGALDERAEGRWTREGNTIRLTTVPKPKPPVFSAGAAETVAGAPFSVTVTWPNGRGVAGVDVLVGFDHGEPLEGYTQEDGWSLDPAEKRTPRSVTFAVPMHGLRSQNFAIDAGRGNRATFTLTPNDLGVVDLEGVSTTVRANRVVMQREGRDLTYVTVKN